MPESERPAQPAAPQGAPAAQPQPTTQPEAASAPPEPLTAAERRALREELRRKFH